MSSKIIDKENRKNAELLSTRDRNYDNAACFNT